jgi:hypothetical protein
MSGRQQARKVRGTAKKKVRGSAKKSSEEIEPVVGRVAVEPVERVHHFSYKGESSLYVP